MLREQGKKPVFRDARKNKLHKKNTTWPIRSVFVLRERAVVGENEEKKFVLWRNGLEHIVDVGIFDRFRHVSFLLRSIRSTYVECNHFQETSRPPAIHF